MVAITFRPATADDARHIGLNLRASDAREVALMRPDLPAPVAVEVSRASSIFSRVAEVDGKTAVIFGVTPSGARLGWGVPWLLATDDAMPVAKRLVRQCRPQVDDMHREFACLHNIVHRENHVSINWLRWLGFTVDEVPCGPRHEFFMFQRTAHV